MTRDRGNRHADCVPEEDLVAYSLGETETIGFEKVKTHLAECADCRQRLQEYQALKQEMISLDREVECPDLSRSITFNMFKFPDEERNDTVRAPKQRQRIGLERILGIAAAALLIMGVGIFFRQYLLSTDQRTAKSESVEEALDSGAEWLLNQQCSHGGWSVETLGGEERYVPALNGLALIALKKSRAQGPEVGRAVQRAADHLIGNLSSEGRFGGLFERTMYNQSIATFALLEAYDLTGDPSLQKPIGEALDYICARQLPHGGWGYEGLKSSRPNTSVTAWQIQTLIVGHSLGWKGNMQEIHAGLEWMAHRVDSNGLFSYGASSASDAPERETLTMMGAHCILMAESLDIPVNSRIKSTVMKRVGAVAARRPGDYYGAFFYAATLSDMGEAAFGDALAGLKSSLIAKQRNSEGEEGSWSPNDRWGLAGGSIYSTSMSMLALDRTNTGF